MADGQTDYCGPLRRRILRVAPIACAALVAGCAGRQMPPGSERPLPAEPIAEDRVMSEAQEFFGRGAQGLADVLNRVFRDKGPPTAYVKGEEGGGALGVGLRYGSGVLYMNDGTTTEVFWSGPSIGFDVGGSAAKTFMLVYDLPSLSALYNRYGGVEGSLYFVGGVGVNYNSNGSTVLAPVRFGVGWRQGVNVGYLRLTPERHWNPF